MDFDIDTSTGVIGIFFFGVFGLVLAFYIYAAICLSTIARKLSVAEAWWAWVPLLNALLIFKLSGKPLWWLLGLFVPILNIVVAVLVWMEIAKRRGKSPVHGILILLPGIGLISLGILAFSKP